MEKMTSSYHSDFGIQKTLGRWAEQHLVSRLVGHELAGDLFGMEKKLSDYVRLVPGLEVAPLVHP
jgi:hypothetical protein